MTGTAAPVARPALPNDKTNMQPALAAAGKDAAQTGEDLPVRAHEAAAEDVERAVRKLNELMRERERNLSFHVDEASGRTVITVLDAASNRVVRQIPSEEVLAVSRALEATGALIEVDA